MNRSGLLALRRAVARYFQVQQIAAEVAFGMKARDLWSKSRVVIIHGRFDGAVPARPMAGGSLGPPQKKQSENPRELAEDTAFLTLSIFAVDPTNLESEEAQEVALENLTESTIQAMWNAIDPETKKNVGGPAIEWGDYLLLQPPTQMAYGRERLQYLTWRAPYFDLPQTVVFPTVTTLNRTLTT